MKTKIYWLPINNPRHSSVCGYHANTLNGRWQWDQLDWGKWWLDGSNSNFIYLHVATKPELDGAVYRVRCWYKKYQGIEVVDVGIGFLENKLCWIVTTKGTK